MMVNKQYIRNQIKKIEKVSLTNPDQAHLLEDQLHLDVMKSVAEGDWTAKEIQTRIRIALQSTWVEFSRWTG